MEYLNDAKNKSISYISAYLSNGNPQNGWASVSCCKCQLSCRGAIALSEIMPKPVIPRRQFFYKEVISYFKALINKHIKKRFLQRHGHNSGQEAMMLVDFILFKEEDRVGHEQQIYKKSFIKLCWCHCDVLESRLLHFLHTLVWRRDCCSKSQTSRKAMFQKTASFQQKNSGMC